MELRHLRYFVAVAEELHFGRAAERLYIAQSALSQQILDLEAEIGVQLLERTKRRVQLTRAGEAFWEDSRQILERVEEAVERSQKIARGETGKLRVGFTILALHALVTEILAEFQRLHPQVQLVLNEMSTQTQVAALHQKQIDVGFLHPPIEERNLELFHLKTEAMVVALASKHPLARSPRITVKALSSYPLIIHPRHEGPILYDRILQMYAEANCQPNIAQEATTSPTRIGLAATGMGVTFVPGTLSSLNYAGIVYKPLSGAVPKLDYAIAWRRDEEIVLARSLLNVTKTVVGSL